MLTYVKVFKELLLKNQQSDFNETIYVAYWY